MKQLDAVFCWVALALVLAVPTSFAGKGTDLKPSQPGKLIVDEKFAGSALPKMWAAAKGDWQVSSGALIGKENASDNHAAVIALSLPNRNSIARFSFQFNGAKTLHLSFNHAKGHLFRVAMTPESVAIIKDKDKKDPQSKMEPLGKAATKFAPGQWYTMLVAITGTKVAAQTDNGVKLDGSHPGLDMDKTGYRFVTSGESVAISDLTIWELPR
ncbi:MAG: hypothetical protein FJ395_17720 [Verrucomicrobia bacterium]|nr:hypothetical protein [Verrucomicrobiota bacterium]